MGKGSKYAQWRVLLLQALQARGTSALVQSLLSSEVGEKGLVQGLQQALSDRPQLRTALEKLLQNSNP